jgi:Transposase zinc-binding domain
MAKSGRPPFEVADVFRRFGEEYRAKGFLSLNQLRVMQHIEDCRTAALGGHVEECDICNYKHPAYVRNALRA